MRPSQIMMNVLKKSGGAAAAPFTPNSITGLKVWLKADAGLYTDAGKTTPATNDGTAIYTWADQTANGLDAVQSNATYQPLLKLNIINNMPAILSDGSDDSIVSTFTLSNITDFSVFVVIRSPATSPTDSLVFSSNGRNLAFGRHGTGDITYYPSSGINGFADNHFPINTNKIVIYVKTGANVAVYSNGTSIHTASNANNTTGLTSFGLFSVPATRANPGLIYIGEIGVYENHAFTADEITKLNTYLNTRWAVF